jgi:hypothetical protein
MKKNLILIFTFFICNYNLVSQEIDATATTTSISFTNEEGYTTSTHVNALSDFVATSSGTARQVISNGGDNSSYHRITVKTQYQRHQKNLPFTGASGDILTLKIKFKINGTLVANKEVFSLGLKSVFDASNTQTIVTANDAGQRNGEVLSIHNDASNLLNIRYKTNAATAAYDTSDWKELTIKYFIGDNLTNSRIKAKLDNGAVSSGWVNQSWTSQLLYDAITTGSGAYMIFASNTALGSDASANHLYIDQYDFTTSGDNGLIFLGGGFVASTSWNTQVSPSGSDRLFLFGNTANLNNGSSDFSYDYMYLDPASTLNVTNVNSLVLNDLDVDGALDIKTGENSVTINNNLTIDASATSNIANGSSLLVNGTASGNLTHTRTLATTNWYGITSPVNGQDIDTFISAEGLAQSTEDSDVGLSQSYGTFSDTWTYYNSSSSSSGNFIGGKGYIIKLVSAGDISFTGTFRNSDISRTLSTGGNGFNFAGNPFASYTDIASMLTTNSGILDEETIWLWNQATASYDTKVTADAYKLAPGQAFFIKSDGESGTLALNKSFQTHHTSDTFQRTENRPELYLSLSDGSVYKEAKIYYIDGATTSFDNGYDGTLFNGVSNPLAIYTHLVTDSEGKNYQVQSLPNNDFENIIIPLGINAEAGTSITIDASKNNFPSEINIYLEDKQDNSFTLLEADSNFSFTPENNLDGIGRFYLHTTSGVLSANDFATNTNISIYTSSNDNLRIAGVQKGTATVRLYNILGKEVLNTSFVGSGVNDINLNAFPVGIYIVKLTTENGTLNRKIIIQ